MCVGTGCQQHIWQWSVSYGVVEVRFASWLCGYWIDWSRLRMPCSKAMNGPRTYRIFLLFLPIPIRRARGHPIRRLAACKESLVSVVQVWCLVLDISPHPCSLATCKRPINSKSRKGYVFTSFFFFLFSFGTLWSNNKGVNNVIIGFLFWFWFWFRFNYFLITRKFCNFRGRPKR